MGSYALEYLKYIMKQRLTYRPVQPPHQTFLFRKRNLMCKTNHYIPFALLQPLIQSVS